MNLHWSVRFPAAEHLRRSVTLLLALVTAMPVLLAVPMTPAAAQAPPRPGSGDDVLRILFFDKQAGHNPDAMIAAIEAEALALDPDAEFVRTGDAAIFTNETELHSFDTLVFAHTGQVLFDEAQRDGLQAYVQAGGGWMGLHYAGWSRGTSEHDQWEWYHDLVGGKSDGHPEIQTATLRVPEPSHPLVQGLAASFQWNDEFYDWVVNPTANVRTLVEVDELTISQPRDPADNYDGRRNGTSHPMTWCQDFDGGRSWFTALGHFGSHYDEPALQTMISHGVAYTSGLVEADCSPPAKDVHGGWSGVTPWPLIPINASLTGEGLVQSFGSVITGNDQTPYDWSGNGPVFQGGQFETDVWDPSTTRTVANVYDGVVPNITYADLFCSIQVWDPHRRATLTAGGDDGLGGNAPNDAALGVTSYSSRDGLQAEAPMNYPRWYPTATTTPDGDIVVQGGSLYGGPGGPGALTPEIYTPDEGSGWQTLPGATSTLAYGNGGGANGPDENRWWYPRAFVAPGSGTIFNISGTQMFELDPYAGGGDGAIYDRGRLLAGSGDQGALGNPVGATSTAVMYRPGQILQVGGGWWANGGGPQGARAGFTVDIRPESGGTAAPVVAATQPMEYGRHWATSTLLPDGDVLVTGGSVDNNGDYGNATNPEIWDPDTGEWTTVEVPAEHARLYHSSALLLPDGRVMVGGGGAPGPRNYTDVEFYSPAYLFDGDQPAVRPVITDAPAEIGYDGVFDLGVDGPVSRVTLVRNGSVTHGFNNDQRFQELTFTQAGGTLTVDSPIDGTYAPPGAYMVFVFDEDGTPSVASMLHIDPEVAMDHRTPQVVDQFEYPRVISNPPTTITVAPGDGRMAPWTIDSQVELVRGIAGSNGGLERVGYHLALGAAGSLQRPIEDLQPGREYRISLRYARDSRAAEGATAELSIGSLTATLAPTGGQVSDGPLTSFGTYVGTFTADERSEVLTLASTGTGGVIVDNLVIISTEPGLQDVPVHYEFSEGAGTTAANTGTDTSTGPATLTGTTGWTGPDGGVFGTGLDLPGGAGNVVDLPDDLLEGAEDFSVSLWANPDQLANWTALFQIGEGLGNSGSYFQIQSQTQTAGNTGLAATFKTAGAGAPEERVLDGTNDPDLIPGQDNHVAFTREGAVGILYLNGEEVARREDLTISLADLGSTTDNWLGRNGYPDAPFAGTMDDVRLYTSALTGTDVAALYADGSALRTTTTVSVDPASPSPFAQPITVSGTVTDEDAQPAVGSAELLVDGTRRGEAVVLVDGDVTFPELSLSPGEHDIEIRYQAAEGYRDSQGSVSHTVERPDVGDGVPIHYTFDEGTGTTAANSGVDPSVGPAMLDGAAAFTTNGRFGPGVDLPGGASGTGNQIRLPDDISAGMDEEFSVSVWARPDALPTWVPLLQIGSSTDTFFLLQSSLGGGTGGGFGATFKQAGDPTQERLVLGSGNDLPLDEWTHVVFTMSGSTGRIYFDGELMGTRTDFTIGIGDVGVDGSTTANLIGGTSWPDPRWNGIVDDFQMFGYELTAEEIAELGQGPGGNAPPIADDDDYTTDEDTPLVVDAPGVLANDSDADEDTLTATNGSDPANGEVALAADGSFTYTPDAGFSGIDTFTYTANDGTVDSVPATVTITVGEPPPPPGPAAPIHYTFDEGTGTSAANTGTNASIGAGTLLGSTGWNEAGRFGPAVNLPGGASSTNNHVRLPNNIEAGLDEEFSVAMWARPDALPNWVPLLQIGSSTDTFFLLQSSTQANGPTGFAATFKAPGNPTQERLTLGSGNDLPLNEWTHVVFTMSGSTGRIYFDGELQATRSDFTLGIGDVGVGGNTTANFVGGTSWPDSRFDGLVDDLRIYGSELSPAQVTELFDGTPANTAPVAVDDAYQTDEDTALTVAAPGVLSNDTDANGDDLTVALGDDVANGTLDLAADGSFTYTPDAGFNGTDTFTYTANDGVVDSPAATVTITVGTPPPPPGPAAPIHYTFDEGEGTTAANSGTDDTIGDATLIGTTGWASGTFGNAASLPGGGNNSNYVDLPDDLFALADDAITLSMWIRPDALPNWVSHFQVGNGTDEFFLVQSSTNNGDTGFAVTLRTDDAAQHRLVLDEDLTIGEWTHVAVTMDGPVGRIYFDGQLMGERLDFPTTIDDIGVDGQTTENFIGSTSWADPVLEAVIDDVRIYGRALAAEEITELFDGTPLNTAPVAVDDAYETEEDVALTVAAPGVLGNDTDADDDALTTALVADVTNGTVDLAADGSFTYTPDTGFAGTDTFTYTANDGKVDSVPATVTITVEEPPNTAPVGADDVYEFVGPFLTVQAPGVLANDTDAEGDDMTVTLVDDVRHGTVVLAADGSFTYTADPGVPRDDSFTYVVSDGTTDSEVVTVTLARRGGPPAGGPRPR